MNFASVVIVSLLVARSPNPFPSDGPATLAAKIVATVGGEAITAQELARYTPPGASDSEQRSWLRRLVVEKRIDQAARSAQVKVTDERLAVALRERRDAMGGTRGYAELLRRLGRSPEADRAEVRRALEGEEYIARCLGESPDPKLVRPELARLLQVSTQEIQAAWREHRERFVRPGRVEVTLIVVKHAAYADPDAAREALANALKSASPAQLEASYTAQTPPPNGFTIARKQLDAPAVDALLPGLRETARSGAAGTVSAIADSDSACLAIEVLGREPDQKLEFDAAGDLIREWLRSKKRRVAVEKLVASLLGEVSVWPDDLFLGAEPDSLVAPTGGPP